MADIEVHPIHESLELIQEISEKNGHMKVGQIFEVLSEKGFALLLILFSLPFCTPLQIPGFSTPFGLMLSFIGFRIAFRKKTWWPKKILEKEISKENIDKLVQKTKKVLNWLSKITQPRFSFLIENHLFRITNGILIFLMGLILCLPLPIPMSNLLSALPILFFGLGLLEEDGVMIIIAYTLASICFLGFILLISFGKRYL